MENTLNYQRDIAKSMQFFSFLSWDELNNILLNQKKKWSPHDKAWKRE